MRAEFLLLGFQFRCALLQMLNLLKDVVQHKSGFRFDWRLRLLLRLLLFWRLLLFLLRQGDHCWRTCGGVIERRCGSGGHSRLRSEEEVGRGWGGAEGCGGHCRGCGGGRSGGLLWSAPLFHIATLPLVGDTSRAWPLSVALLVISPTQTACLTVVGHQLFDLFFFLISLETALTVL